MSTASYERKGRPNFCLNLIAATRTGIAGTLIVAVSMSPLRAETQGFRATYDANSPRGVIAGAVEEASRRFHVPAAWIRAVMRAESDGEPNSVSPKGAIGLMQLMPNTYIEMRAKLGLGSDPFDPRDNILAGAAYLAEMFDRYGATGFLAAYNAGPQRYEDYLFRSRPLPAETMDYVAWLTPRLGLARAPIAQRGAWTDPLHRSIFPKSVAVNLSNDSFPKRATKPSDQPYQAAPHPLFSASSPSKIFADRPQFFGGPKTPSGAIHLQPGGLFVAHTTLKEAL